MKKKKSLIRGLLLSVGLLLVGSIFVGTRLGLADRQDYQKAEAGSGPTYSITQAQIQSASVQGKKESGIFDWEQRMYWDKDDQEAWTTGGPIIDAWHDNLKNVCKVTVKIKIISYDGSTAPKIYFMAAGTSSKKTLQVGNNTFSWNVPSGNVSTGADYVLFYIESTNNEFVYFKGHDANTPMFTIETNDVSRTVTATAGTGVTSVALADNTSGTNSKASGSKFDDGTTVYAFATINSTGYNPQSSWASVSGSTYRVASYKINGSNYSFGTINAVAKTKSVTFDANGGTPNKQATLTYDTAFTGTIPTRAGYDFAGWNTKADGTGTSFTNSFTAAQVNGIVTGSTALTNSKLYAQWTGKSYTVTLSPLPGTAGTKTSFTATMGQDLPNLTAEYIPTRAGYTFSGFTYAVSSTSDKWYYNSNGQALAKWDIPSNATLNAQWTPNSYPVYITGGTGIKDVHLSYSSYALEPLPSGSEYYMDNKVYGFVEMEEGYVAPDNTWTAVSGQSKSRGEEGYLYCVGNLTVTNSATANDFGSFNAVLGDFNVGASKGAGIDTIYLSSNPEDIAPSPASTQFTYGTSVSGFATLKPGYHAKETWVLVSGTEGASDALYRFGVIESIGVNSTFGIVAADPNHYSLALEGLQEEVEVVYDATLPDLDTLPTLEGYTFAGYYDQQEGGVMYYDASGKGVRTWDKVDENPSLFARWTKNMTYVVTGYEADYDAGAHGITITVSDPSEGAVIEYKVGSNPYSTSPITYTNVGEYEIYYRISADVGGVLYTTVEGKETVVILEVNKDALAGIIDTATIYYNEISSNYGAAGTYLNSKINDATTIYNNENVTAETVADAVDALEDGLNHAYAMVSEAKIEAIGTLEFTSICRGKIDDAYAYYHETLNDEQRALVDPDLVALLNKDYNDFYTVRGVANEIIELMPLSYGDDQDEALNAAKAHYDALTQDQLAFFPESYHVLLEDLFNAYDVIEVIHQIGTVEDSEDSLHKIEEARAAYNALPEDKRQYVPVNEYEILTNAEKVYDVMHKIGLIGEVTYDQDCLDRINTALNAYNLLGAELKELVSNYPTLQSALNVYEVMDLIANLGDVRYRHDFANKLDIANSKYEALSEEEQATISNYDELVSKTADYNAVDDFVKAVLAIVVPLKHNDATTSSIAHAGELLEAMSDDQRAVLIDDSLETLTYYLDILAAYDVVEKIHAIGGIVDTPECEERIVTARLAYSALDDDQQELIDADELKLLADSEEVYPVVHAIGVIAPLKFDANTNEKILHAREVYDLLEEDQKAKVSNYNVLLQAEHDYQIVEFTVGLINNIGTVELTDASKEKIEAARAAYDNLTAFEKGILPQEEYQKLLTAESKYAALEVEDKINNIGTVELTDTCKAKIDIARNAYDALSDVEKQMVRNDIYKILVDDEHVYEGLKLIAEIGNVEYTSESKDKIDAAKEYYDSLTGDQKQQIGPKAAADIKQAEESYSTLDTVAKVLSTLFLILTCLLLLLGAYFLYRLLRKGNDSGKGGNGKGGKTVKAASVSGILPILFVNHYTDAPFIALYVLAGLTIIIWCVVLCLFLKKRKALKNFPQVGEEKKEEVVPSEETSDDEGEEEVVTVTDEKGNVFQIRYVRSFKAKLAQSNDELKACYNEIKNYVLSYKKVSSRVSWQYDSVNFGREQVLKFMIRGKTLCVYFALNADEVDDKYKVEKVESKKFEGVPCLYRIKNDRRREYAKELIDIVMRKLGVEKGKESHEDFSLPYEDNAALIAKGLIKELKISAAPKAVIDEHHDTISVFEADERMSDEEAESQISDDLNSTKHKGKKGIINIDTISENFNDGDTVDIEALWEKNLVPPTIGFVKVLARGSINKRLNLDLQDYSVQAVKMVLLEGGTVKRAK